MSPHKPRKRFGQHFLTNDHIIQKIVDFIHPNENDHLIEIGPGQGAITHLLANSGAKLDVIEIDRDLVPRLQDQYKTFSNVTIHLADALTVDFNNFKSSNALLRIVGNLPYNISTPLIFHLLNYEDQIQDMVFMLQKEVVERMAAQPGDHHYGRLSIMVQYHCQVQALFIVKPSAFFPPPKVDSQIIHLMPHQTKPHIADNETLFGILVRDAFSQRRKTLKNALKHLVPDPVWQQYGGNISLRPEDLGIDDYVLIANILHNYQKSR